MKLLLEVCLVALTLSAGINASNAAKVRLVASDRGSFGGIWEAKMNNLPGVRLKIRETDRKISGDILFYLQKRRERGGPWHIAGESAAPLLAPHVEGKTFTFEVRRERCHGCSELDTDRK